VLKLIVRNKEHQEKLKRHPFESHGSIKRVEKILLMLTLLERPLSLPAYGKSSSNDPSQLSITNISVSSKCAPTYTPENSKGCRRSEGEGDKFLLILDYFFYAEQWN